MNQIVKTKREKRFTKPKYKEFSISSLLFGRSLKSYKSDEFFFTNFASSKKSNKYKLVKEYVKLTINNDLTYLKSDFGFIDEIGDTKNSFRVLHIINYGYNHYYGKKDLINIYKLQHKKDKELQFYLLNNNGNLEVLLIDIYHLVLPAAHFLPNGEVIGKNMARDYHKRKQNNCSLKNICNDLNLDETSPYINWD